MKALVIDDSKAIRSIVGKIMKESNYEVFEACNGLEALDQVAKNGPFAIALVDWNMPEMNGYEFVQAIRAKSEHADMKLMMVTTETEITQVMKALEAGANEYVMKPFTKDVIVEKLGLLGLMQP